MKSSSALRTSRGSRISSVLIFTSLQLKPIAWRSIDFSLCLRLSERLEYTHTKVYATARGKRLPQPVSRREPRLQPEKWPLVAVQRRVIRTEPDALRCHPRTDILL